jgi:hypothetical protein
MDISLRSAGRVAALLAVTASTILSPLPVEAQQTPSPANADGTPFLKVNINPTDVPPIVNISPRGRTPEVDIRRMLLST